MVAPLVAQNATAKPGLFNVTGRSGSDVGHSLAHFLIGKAFITERIALSSDQLSSNKVI